jgi:hypothetical protein
VANHQRIVSKRREITASWLTAVLRAAGHLPYGKVATLAVERWRGKALSDLYRLEATYSESGDAPPSFVLKVGKPDETSSIARRRRWKEHAFYSRVVPVMGIPPVPRPFAAAYDPETMRSHLLLEDLTLTHRATPAPLPPPPDHLRGEIDCLAEVHAWWWNDAEVSAAAAARDEAWIAARAASVQRRRDRFLAAFGDHLPDATRVALETTAGAWPAILRRTARLPLSIVHGDAHPWNFLVPLPTTSRRTCLLDWEGWSIEPGPHDLASLVALHLPVGERRALEAEMVGRYSARLQEHGVTGYDSASCWDDYRWAIARRVQSPVGLWSRGTSARSWWPALEHITMAYHDLRCEEAI